VSLRYRSSTIICLDVEPPADDGGEHIFGYRVDYDQGKVLEFAIGEFTRAENIQIFTAICVYFLVRSGTHIAGFGTTNLVLHVVLAGGMLFK